MSVSKKPAARAFLARRSIRGKILRQSVLLVTFCVLLLGGLSFFIITSFQESLSGDAVAQYELELLGGTVLILSGLLFLLAVFLGTLLARALTGPLLELTAKVSALRSGTWKFRRTVHTGDEVEMLDRVVDDLTTRLRDAYEHLEEKVADRTRQVQEESALDRAILRSIEYGVLAMDREGVVTDANPAACALLRRPKDVLMGCRGADVLPVSKKHQKDVSSIHPVTQVLRTGTPYRSHPSHHLSLLRADDSILPVTLQVVPLLRGNRRFGAIAVFQDQTVERQIDYMKSEFISLAGHQLRTPLSSVRWYIEMLSSEQGKFSEEHKSYLQEADSATKRMTTLIDALLHVARLEDGALVANTQPVNLSTYFHRIAGEWMTMAKEQGVRLVTVTPRKSATVTTDPVLLEIVLQNLFANALKYSPAKKEITVTVVVDDHHIRITVRDLGVGIPQSEQKRIFEKFFRAHNVREIDTDGTGLGLYMSRTIVEQLGGTLIFESEEGKGSRFTVMLPV